MQSTPINIFSNLRNLSGVGDRLESFLSNLVGGNRVVDLLYHFPAHSTPKKFLPPLYEIKNKELIISKVKVEAHLKPARSSQPFRIRCFAPSGYLTLIFFKTFPNYIEKNFPIGAEIVVSGWAERFNDELQMAHPDYVFPAAEIYKIPQAEIVYPAIANLSQKFLRAKIGQALSTLPELPEWIDGKLLQQQNWLSWKKSIANLHSGTNNENDLASNSHRKRLAFDELLASQIAHIIAKKQLRQKDGQAIIPSNIIRKKLCAALPFELTNGQKKVLGEIDLDLKSGKKMLRLLQGDVGSGKTIVAFLTMLAAIENKGENKRQAAIICPITLLAIQHHKNFSAFAELLGIKIALLTSKTTKKNKQKILDDLKNGEIDILIGTHALIEPDIIFKDLAIIVIDEQHRFGVNQRMRLVEKGNQANVLLMSATPIPRSLMMTLYGDMDISILNEKPQNRISIDTRVISQNKDQEILQAIARAVKNGEKIYWICPLIEELEGDNNPPLEGVSLPLSTTGNHYPPLEGASLPLSTTGNNNPPLEGGSNLVQQDLGRGHPPPKAKRLYSATTLSNAQKLRQNKTDAENFLWYHLQNKQLGGHKFRQQHPFDKYIVDFICLEAKLIIELDGDQHGKKKSIKYDAARTRFLEDAGYKVLRFWNNEVFDNIFGVLDFVLSELDNFSRARHFDPSPNLVAQDLTLPQGEGYYSQSCLKATTRPQGEGYYSQSCLKATTRPQGKGNYSNSDLSNVTTRFAQFQKLFGEEKVGIIHGKMKEKEKDKIMNDFISGGMQILVATTVIEVGIDVRDATIIVIENCEQFGLSQLHQLRGRVGRGEKPSFCILLYGKKLGAVGKQRLTIMKNSNDGFFIAEEDLKLRGSGQLIGTRQSGLPEYKIADLNCDLDLLNLANRYAKFLLENEERKLNKEALKILLKIFNYEDCFKLVFGG